MYVARFESDAGNWVQAIACLPAIAPAARRAAEWWEEIPHHLRGAARIPGATVLRRISIDRERRLRQVVGITAPAEHEGAVRRVMAGLTRLERLIGGTVEAPVRAEDHDTALSTVPPLRFSPQAETFAMGGLAIACDFRIAPILDDLLADACLHGQELSYQMHLRNAEPDREVLRAARRQALNLQSVPGAGTVVGEWQDGLAKAYAGSAALCEEFVAVSAPDTADSAGQRVADAFRARYSKYGFAAGAP